MILSKIKAHKVENQKQLVEILKEDGFDVSQTTVSRDLTELGVAKGRDKEGRSRYGDPMSLGGAAAQDALLKRVAPEFMLAAESTGNLVVVKTSTGGAQGLAAAVDAARLEGVAGTVAGDDTIVVVCSEGAASEEICTKLLSYAVLKK